MGRTESQAPWWLQIRAAVSNRTLFHGFLCRKHRLVVEIDGSQHVDNAYDRARDENMRSAGFSVIRFWSADVLRQRNAVCETILAALDGRLSENIVASDLRYVFAAGKSAK